MSSYELFSRCNIIYNWTEVNFKLTLVFISIITKFIDTIKTTKCCGMFKTSFKNVGVINFSAEYIIKQNCEIIIKNLIA